MIRRSGQLAAQSTKRLLAVACGHDLEAIRPQLVREQREHVVIVVDQQDPVHAAATEHRGEYRFVRPAEAAPR